MAVAAQPVTAASIDVLVPGREKTLESSSTDKEPIDASKVDSDVLATLGEAHPAHGAGHEDSGIGSRSWSEDAYDTTHPPSTEETQISSEDLPINGMVHGQGFDASKDVSAVSNDEDPGVNGIEPVIEDDHGLHVASSSQPNFHEQSDLIPQEDPSSADSLRPISEFAPPLPSVSEHLLQLSVSKVWADWSLVINAKGVQPFASYAHSAMLIRSPRLARMMSRQASVLPYNGNLLQLHLPRPVSPPAFEAALRFLYSDTVLTDSLFPAQSSPETRAARPGLLDYLMSYWVSGIELGLEPVATRSARLLGDFVNWDVVEAIIREADDLDMGSRQVDEQIGFKYAASAMQLKQTVLSFFIARLDFNSFRLDTSVSSPGIRLRFAQIEDSRVRHNPALARMVFGSMPSSADLSPSSPQSEILPTGASMEEQMVSNVLLNLDFEDLAYFSRHLQEACGDAAMPILSKLVEERESRRTKVISNPAVLNKQRMTNSEVWDVAGFSEFLSGGALKRERVGFLLPTKSR